jgi:hypothetical protein
MDYVYGTFIDHTAALHAKITEKFRSVGKGIFYSYVDGTDVRKSIIRYYVLVD